jgi:hypothetical protein
VEDDTRARSDPARVFDRVVNFATRGALLALGCHVVRFLPLQGLNWLESLP